MATPQPLACLGPERWREIPLEPMQHVSGLLLETDTLKELC